MESKERRDLQVHKVLEALYDKAEGDFTVGYDKVMDLLCSGQVESVTIATKVSNLLTDYDCPPKAAAQQKLHE